MEKVNMEIDNKSVETSFKEALKDPQFKKIASTLGVPPQIAMKYTSLLEDAALEQKNCATCKGLNFCKNAMPGCFMTPLFDGTCISLAYQECHYKQEKEKNLKTASRELEKASFKDLDVTDKKRKEVLTWVKKFYDDFDTINPQKGLYLHGPFGCGKTYLLAAMINELAKDNVKSVIVYWPEYLRSLKESFQFDLRDEFKNKFNEVKYSKLLLIDDLGAEGVTSWSRDEILGTILQYRMQEDLPTFITSNLNIKELQEHLSVTTSNKSEKLKSLRIIERIKQLTSDVEMIGENKRK